MPDFLCGEKIRGGSVRTREQQVIQVKFCPSSRDTTLNCIPFQLGKGYVRARYRSEGCCTSTMLKKKGGRGETALPGSNIWRMGSPSSGQVVLRTPVMRMEE